MTETLEVALQTAAAWHGYEASHQRMCRCGFWERPDASTGETLQAVHARHLAEKQGDAVRAWLLGQTELVARTMALLEPDEDWPTNEALGGNLTGTRDDEYRDAMRDQADAVLGALTAGVGS